jgi:hypothetical protein
MLVQPRRKLVRGCTLVSRQRLLALTLASLPAWLVVVGLLAIPSYCRCGADIPHAHTLFELPGHSHAPGAHDYGDGRIHQHHLSSDTDGDIESVRSWPVVPSWGSGLAIYVTMIELLAFNRPASPWSCGQRLCSYPVAPATPPPRLAAA